MPKNLIHKPLRRRIKGVLLNVSDYIDGICHVRSCIAPPKELSCQYGDGGYFDIGLHFFEIFLQHCHLSRNDAVMEMGCGAGRIATPLSYFLADSGRYEGVDIMPEGIEFCQRSISSRRPNFRFQMADVYSSFYNPAGRQTAESYTFPFPDSSFDFVFSTSLFTHLKPVAVKRYLQQSARVLKSGGVMFHTLFIIDEPALQEMRKGNTAFEFKDQGDGYFTTNSDFPEEAIGIPESAIQSMIQEIGNAPSIKKGTWANRPDGLTGQDSVIFFKP